MVTWMAAAISFDIRENDRQYRLARRSADTFGLTVGVACLGSSGYLALLFATPPYNPPTLGLVGSVGVLLACAGVWRLSRAVTELRRRLIAVGVTNQGLTFDLGHAGRRELYWAGDDWNLLVLDFRANPAHRYATIPCVAIANLGWLRVWGGISSEAADGILQASERAGVRVAQSSTANGRSLQLLPAGRLASPT